MQFLEALALIYPWNCYDPSILRTLGRTILLDDVLHDSKGRKIQETSDLAFFTPVNGAEILTRDRAS